MSEMPVCIAVSDVHCTDRVPVCRAEDSWYPVMKRQFNWLSSLTAQYRCPIVYGGDVFDKASPSAALISFLLSELPHGYSIAGNHDLLYHNLDRFNETGYSVLYKSGCLHHLDADEPVRYKAGDIEVALHGFSFGKSLRPLQDKKSDIDIAVLHRFVWNDGTSFPYAKQEDYVPNIIKECAGYDYYIIGDNHLSFVDGNVINPGGFFRDTITQLDFQPFVYLIYPERISAVPVPVSEDKFADRKIEVDVDVPDMSVFAGGGLATEVIDPVAAVRKLCTQLDVSSEVAEYLQRVCVM